MFRVMVIFPLKSNQNLPLLPHPNKHHCFLHVVIKNTALFYTNTAYSKIASRTHKPLTIKQIYSYPIQPLRTLSLSVLTPVIPANHRYSEIFQL